MTQATWLRLRTNPVSRLSDCTEDSQMITWRLTHSPYQKFCRSHSSGHAQGNPPTSQAMQIKCLQILTPLPFSISMPKSLDSPSSWTALTNSYCIMSWRDHRPNLIQKHFESQSLPNNSQEVERKPLLLRHDPKW